ncbi:MAG: cytochrome-c peroxidase [Rhodobacteraceae bacterium]|nr:cytochrome-c peroxidase [Paracoccaceae bacterium]
MRTAFVFSLLTACPALAGGLPDAPPEFPAQDPMLVQLGWMLFYDPVLSGNREVACATCHHPKFGTSDGLSLGIGDGGMGLGPQRVADPANPPEQRIPRNAPALFNLGATEFTTMFHDGRLEAKPDEPDGIRTPLGQEMVHGFSGVLSAQSMFPVLSGDEMAGHYSENDISQAVRQGFLTGETGAWARISARVMAIPEYREGFEKVTGGVPAQFTDISDALAAFMALEWRADDSPFDRHLRGAAPLTGAALDGAELFYGAAGCSACHSGWFQTDHEFHAIAMPQIGPGKAARFERHARDTGRMRVTGLAEDAYAFRTPSLRNVAQTAPYGHAGAYASLEDAVRHHLDPLAALRSYSLEQARLPDLPVDDLRIMRDSREVEAISRANQLRPVDLSDQDVHALLAFLDSLTDTASLAGRLGVPDAVPSGLPVPQ